MIHVPLLVAGNVATSRKESALQNGTEVSALGHMHQRVRNIGKLAVLDFQG